MVSQLALIGVHCPNWMTMYDEDIRTCRPTIKYNGMRHTLSVPSRSKEHATDTRTRQSVMIQTTCSANWSLRVSLRAVGVNMYIGLPQP
ncbi:hypothetical protein M3J09_011726 [Ascochyta lentis]